jgi:tetratricopeptide (TPR) repeat protein
MKYASICIALALIVATCFPGQATSEPNQSEAAAQLFKAGKFSEAGDIYARIVAQDPKDYSALLQLGRVALLANRLDDAQKWLEAAIALRPGDDDAKVMLAEALYRRDDFQKAAAALRGVEVGTNKLIIEQYPALSVAKLESFKGQTPYEVHGDGQITRLKFLKADPLPLVSVRVNGGDEVTFFIDTGGSEVALPTSRRSSAFRNSAKYKAHSLAASTPRLGTRALKRSPSATGLFGTCLSRHCRSANSQQDLA